MRVQPVTVHCLECERELAGDSPDLRLDITWERELLVYCAACWEREFGQEWAAIPQDGIACEKA